MSMLHGRLFSFLPSYFVSTSDLMSLGMSRTRPRACSGLPRTITTFCKASHPLISDLPKRTRRPLTLGSSRTDCAGLQRAALWHPAEWTLSLLVCFTSKFWLISFYKTHHASDDPQMPGLIPLIKKVRPGVPIVYRSHIEIRSDLVHIPGSPQEEVWNYLWNNIKLADLFISAYNFFCPCRFLGLT
jgi:hypothetical protein